MNTDPNSLPDLSSPYSIDDVSIVRFRRDGHIFLPGVLSMDEATAYRPAIREAALRYNSETRPVEERDTYGKAFLQVMNLWAHDEAVRRFSLARRMGRIAAELMGVDAVRIYHDQALFKEPGGGPTPWHQDQYYWPLDTGNTVTLWMPMVPIKAGIGPMTFATGSQNLGYLGEFKISDESDAIFEKMIRDQGLPLSSPGDMQPGDATFHSGWTLHGAPGNPTESMREVMTAIYFADGTRILPPDNPNREDDLRMWLPGLKPGDLAASELNPIVYSELT